MGLPPKSVKSCSVSEAEEDAEIPKLVFAILLHR